MSSQAVGGAVGRNPISIIVPCHRVVSQEPVNKIVCEEWLSKSISKGKCKMKVKENQSDTFQ